MDIAPDDPAPSQEPRSAEEKAVAENVTWLATQLASAIAFAKKVRWVVVFVGTAIVAIASVLNAYASWAGAQRSAPGQRIEKVEVRVSELESTVKEVRAALDSMISKSDGKFGLLLRISCRGLEFRDLLDDCRAVGANR